MAPDDDSADGSRAGDASPAGDVGGWRLDAADGALLVHTDTTGPAARLGHRLILEVTSWSVEVAVADGATPVAVTLHAEVDSLTVRDGHGGLTPMTAPERSIARSNALKDLRARRYPRITFAATAVAATAGGYRLDGTLDIRGTQRRHSVEVAVEERDGEHRLSVSTPIRQTDFGITPHSVFLGSVKVADIVTVSLEATRPRR